MDEFALIERYFASRANEVTDRRPDVRVGIGDDAAVIRPEAGTELVIATDTIVENTHFPAGTPPGSLGHRSLAVNLSDLASMGATPLWCTLAITMPTGSAEWVDAFSSGFMALANDHDVALIGGDTTRGPLSVTVTVHGRVESGAAILRSGAGPGEGIYVSGTPGAAAAGRATLTSDPVGESNSGLVSRFLYPTPRIDAGLSLRGIASAMIDISDGLHVDMCRLLRASGIGARMNVESLPLHEEAIVQFGYEQAKEFALTGGDDYELCFTVPEDCEERLRRAASGWSCGITRIGETVADDGIVWRDSGRAYRVSDRSFRHFQQADS